MWNQCWYMDVEICDVPLAHFTGSSTSSVGNELQEVFLSSFFMGGKQVWIASLGIQLWICFSLHMCSLHQLASMRKATKDEWNCARKIYSLLKFEWVKTFNGRAIWSSSDLSVDTLHFECKEEPGLILKAFDCAKDRQIWGQAVAAFHTALWNSSHHSLNHFTGP